MNYVQKDVDYTFYQISSTRDPTEEFKGDPYQAGRNIRKAKIDQRRDTLSKRETYEDPNFRLQIDEGQKDQDGHPMKTRRLFDVYEKETYFSDFRKQQINLDELKVTPTCLAELGMIDDNYLATLIFSPHIREDGYYQYFVKRNGAYQTDVIDDVIPVQGAKMKPIWGLSYNDPLKILIIKAWIKEKGGLNNVINAKPFEFIQAFGMPGYRACSFKKELSFIQIENISQEVRKKKKERIALNSTVFHIIGKTKDSQKVTDMGLLRNQAAYRIIPIAGEHSDDEDDKKNRGSKKEIKISSSKKIYKVQCSVPTKWVGSLSVINKDVKKVYQESKYAMKLENEFLATEEEILNVFSKFYVAWKHEELYSRNNVLQDCYHVRESPHANTFEFTVAKQGEMNINIDLDERFKKINKQGKERFPHITYFLSRKLRPEEKPISAERESQINASSIKNIDNFKQGDLYTYEYYDIEVVSGYHKSCNRFTRMIPGQYMLYVSVSDALAFSDDAPVRNNNANGSAYKIPAAKHYPYTLTINTNASLQGELEEVLLSRMEARILVDSTIFSYGKDHGIYTEIDKKTKTEKLIFGNSFQDIGFGFLIISTSSETPNKLLMRAYIERFRKAGLRPCRYYEPSDSLPNMGDESESPSNINKKQGELALDFSAENGGEQVIVLRRLRRFEDNEQYPPPNCVDFFFIANQRKYQKSAYNSKEKAKK